MTDTKEVLVRLKEVKKERKLSLQNIMDMLEKNGDYISKATLSRIFTDGSESVNFRYEDTIRPLANALLNLDHSEEDVSDVRALKSIIHFKNEAIKQLQDEISSLKIAHAEKLDREHSSTERRVGFLKDQIRLKDDRITKLLDAIIAKDNQHELLINEILNGRE